MTQDEAKTTIALLGGCPYCKSIEFDVYHMSLRGVYMFNCSKCRWFVTRHGYKELIEELYDRR